MNDNIEHRSKLDKKIRYLGYSYIQEGSSYPDIPDAVIENFIRDIERDRANKRRNQS